MCLMARECLVRKDIVSGNDIVAKAGCILFSLWNIQCR